MKTISILGACVSRELFNDHRLINEFKINVYAFQTNLWDMMNQPLGMSNDIINQIPIENFTRRNINYDINKTILSDLMANKSDYVIIDLFNICNVCLKISSPKNAIYMKTLKTEVINSHLKKMNLNYKFELINFNDLDKHIINEGLIKLANWLKQNYDEDKIILHYPIFCEQYYDVNGELKKYIEPRKSELKQTLQHIHKYTNILAECLPKCKIFKPTLDHIPTGRLRVADNINHSAVPVHYTNEDANSIVSQFIKLLNFEPAENLSEFELLAKDCLKMSNLASKLNDKINLTNSGIITNLNYYTGNMIDLDNQIIFISAKNQSAHKLHKFFNKNKLGLKMEIAPNQSYIAVINKSDKFFYENVSFEELSLHYMYKNLNIFLASDYKTNLTSIKINNDEYSQNRRGLNFVIVDKNTLKVTQTFYCDTYIDDFLIIRL